MKSKHNRNLLGFAAILAALAASPAAYSAASNVNQAYEDFSGTHWSAPAVAAVAQNKTILSVNAAYEDFSGTHGQAQARRGMAGTTGGAGEKGEPSAKPATAPDLFRIDGDVMDGCSHYLRCN